MRKAKGKEAVGCGLIIWHGGPRPRTWLPPFPPTTVV